MSALRKYINEHRREFDVTINNVNGDTTVFILIANRATGCWLDINVSTGEELAGLKMLMAEWNCLDSSSNLSQTAN